MPQQVDPPPQPRWLAPATREQERQVENFEKNLRVVAIRFARHEMSESVNRRHVLEAFSALARVGLSRVPWWARPELETGMGAFLIASALSIPDVFQVVLPGAKAVQIGVMVATAIVGALLSMHGWMRGR